MSETRYAVPGWMAIAAAALTPPLIVVGIILDIVVRKNPTAAAALLVPYVLIALSQTFLAVYAFGSFKTLLNQRHGFHEVDGLIVAIIVGACLITLIAIGGRATAVLLGVGAGASLVFVAGIIAVGILLAVLSLVFAIRLLHLDSDLGGLLKPYAYATIAAAVCFATIILSPIGMLIDAATNVMLGMIFLRRPTAPEVPEFV
jgi:hypothetical protein